MPRGGPRPGAGAPKGNLNALKHGLRSHSSSSSPRSSPAPRPCEPSFSASPASRPASAPLCRRRRPLPSPSPPGSATPVPWNAASPGAAPCPPRPSPIGPPADSRDTSRTKQSNRASSVTATNRPNSEVKRETIKRLARQPRSDVQWFRGSASARGSRAATGGSDGNGACGSVWYQYAVDE